MSRRKGRIFVDTSGIGKKRSVQSQIRSVNAKIGIIKSGIEKKFTYTNRNFAGATVGILQDPLNTLNRGTQNNQRIGSRVRLTGLNFRFLGATALTGKFRVLLLWDKQNNNSNTQVPSATLFDNTTTDADIIISTYNADNVGKKERFQILYDSGAVDLRSDSMSHKYINKSLRLGQHTSYTGNTGNPTDIDDTCISVYLISDSINVIHGYSVRLSYVDL